MPDEHTPVSRKLRAHPSAAVVASKSIFSIEFVELSSTFVLASTIFGLPLDATRNFMPKFMEFVELSHFFERSLDFVKNRWASKGTYVRALLVEFSLVLSSNGAMGVCWPGASQQ